MSPSAFNPTALDCEQWVKVAKAGGARYMVLVAKHHDGFANWPSRYTDFSIRRFEIRVISYKGGKPILVYEGHNIGHKHIATFPLVRARSIQITITEADGDVVMRDLQAHQTEHKQC